MSNRLILTDYDISTLKCAGRAGKSWSAACKEIGKPQQTVRDAVNRSEELEAELCPVFPNLTPKDPSPSMRRRAVSDLGPLRVDMGNPAVKWLARAWKVAA